ncbi:MAG: hypothetical protein ACLP1X_07445 [Polyangiaceae bacterium]
MLWRTRFVCFVVAFLVAMPGATVSCGSSPTDSGSIGGGGSGGGASGAGGSGGSTASSGGGSGGSSGSSESSSSGSGGSSGATTSGDDGGGSSGGSSGSGSGSGSDASAGSSSGAAPCVKGQVKDDEVVMIGDSYMDLGNVGPTIMMDANNATYRHYYLAGSALNYGSVNLNIPYQFDTLAETDTAVSDPTDIKVVIMDGGGNDVLIDNSQCLTTPVAGDTSCHTAINASVARGQQLEMDMAGKGVQHIVYYFYPDLDPTVSGHQYAGAWVDYAYPLGAAACCGSANVPASGDLSCRGNAQGTDCIWIDTRPLFVGHNDHTDASTYWFMSDNIHPTQPGATAIAAKVWAKMQEYCIAQ